jgi:DTW domain-containing protein YfiP
MAFFFSNHYPLSFAFNYELTSNLKTMPKRPICPDCERPIKTCLCAEIVKLSCNYQLIILQDPKEAKHALSSAPILAKSITGARLVVGEVFDPVALLGDEWKSQALLVYPIEQSLCTQKAQAAEFKYLILLDGTWRKVSRLLHLNPWLTDLACISIESSNASDYKIRKSPRDDGLSTIEAAVSVLNDLHTTQDFSPILSAFHKMIALQIQAMGNNTFLKNYSNKK